MLVYLDVVEVWFKGQTQVELTARGNVDKLVGVRDFLVMTISINQSIFIYHEQFDKTNDTSNLTGQQGPRVH